MKESTAPSTTLVVNEAFDFSTAIDQLDLLESKQKCSVHVNITVVPPYTQLEDTSRKEEEDEEEKVNTSSSIFWAHSGPVQLGHCSYKTATQPSHAVDRAGWQAKIASFGVFDDHGIDIKLEFSIKFCIFLSSSIIPFFFCVMYFQACSGMIFFACSRSAWRIMGRGRIINEERRHVWWRQSWIGRGSSTVSRAHVSCALVFHQSLGVRLCPRPRWAQVLQTSGRSWVEVLCWGKFFLILRS